MTTFPTWLTGPNGERRVFERAEDVPEGWVDGLAAREPPITKLEACEDDLVVTRADGSVATITANSPEVARAEARYQKRRRR